jgi:hypothetical protein
MKLVLDVWYELWEKTGSEGGTNPNIQPDEQDGHYPWREDYPPWIGGKETRAEASFGERVS